MSKANLTTDGGIPIGLRSEFYTVFSANAADVRPIDLSGAREVIFQMSPSQANGWLTGNDGPLGSGQQFYMTSLDSKAIVHHSNDDRLYFRSQDGANPATLFVWVIR
jgi:hypothetical protein